MFVKIFKIFLVLLFFIFFSLRTPYFFKIKAQLFFIETICLTYTIIQSSVNKNKSAYVNANIQNIIACKKRKKLSSAITAKESFLIILYRKFCRLHRLNRERYSRFRSNGHQDLHNKCQHRDVLF